MIRTEAGVANRFEQEVKRACFKWGIGRELYTAPRIWVGSDKCNVKEGKNGKWQCHDDFRVTELEVDDGRISKLTIRNMSRKGVIVYGAEEKDGKAEIDPKLTKAYEELGDEVAKWCARNGHGSDEDVKRAKAGVKKRPEWPERHMDIEYIRDLIAEFRDA